MNVTFITGCSGVKVFVIPGPGQSYLTDGREIIVLDTALLLEYGWVLIVLIGLEGILAADNALVMSIMVKHLPEDKRKKALFYGLAGAFVFRFGSLFIISYLADVWYVQALGAAYLLYISINHIVKQYFVKKKVHMEKAAKKKRTSGLPCSRWSSQTSRLRWMRFWQPLRLR